MPVRTHAIENVDVFWNYESEQDTLFPEMVRLFQNMAKAGRQASEGAEAAGAKDAASADTKTKN